MSREKRESLRNRALQMRHLEGPGAFCFPFLPQVYPKSTPSLPQVYPTSTPSLPSAVHQGRTSGAENLSCSARNEKVFGTGPRRCDTWRDVVRFAARFYPKSAPALPQVYPKCAPRLPQVYPKSTPRFTPSLPQVCPQLYIRGAPAGLRTFRVAREMRKFSELGVPAATPGRSWCVLPAASSAT